MFIQRAVAAAYPAVVEPPAGTLIRAPRAGVRGLGRDLRGYALEARISVQVVFTLRFATLAAVNGVSRPGQTALCAAAWLLATSAAYVFNGLMDLPEDRANGSKRPIAAGLLPARTAAIGCAAAAAGSLALAAAAHQAALVPLLLVHLALGYAYSAPPFDGKRRGSTASLLVLGMGLLTYAGGWLCSDRTHPILSLVLALTMSLWMAAVGAVVKDMSDVVGDAAAGRRTPVLVLGDRPARLLAAFNALAVALGYCVAALCGATRLLPSAILLMVGAFAVVYVLYMTRGGGNRAWRRAPYRAFMVTQYAVHLAVLAA